jgi:hypothetical protein
MQKDYCELGNCTCQLLVIQDTSIIADFEFLVNSLFANCFAKQEIAQDTESPGLQPSNFFNT